MNRASAAVAAMLVLLAASACKHREEVPISAGPSQLFARGRALYATPELVGAGGKTCASCHDKAQPFEAHQLARKIYDLKSRVAFCLLARGKHEPTDDTAQQVRALEAYVVHRFVHDGVVRDESEEGIRRLGEGMHAFLAGEYEKAIDEVRGAHRLIRSEHYHVRALLLEGCIQVFRLEPDDARRAFAEAVRLQPDVQIDRNLFSPKVGALLEETRVSLAHR